MDRLPLQREFYDRDPATVARELLGKRLVRQTHTGLCSGRIVETEAYLSRRDAACHATRGQTKKNASMFGPPGHAYVYMIHSRWCFNAVTEPSGISSAVLIRALEPLVGIDLMRERRQEEYLRRKVAGHLNVVRAEATDLPLRDLCRGPARLCEALDITRLQDGWDLTAGKQLWIEDDPEYSALPKSIVRSPRIGINAATTRLLRFLIAGNPFVSGRRTST